MPVFPRRPRPTRGPWPPAYRPILDQFEDRSVPSIQAVSLSAIPSDTVGVSSGFGVSADSSGDGRFVAFVSDGPNVVLGDTNGVSDVFLFDRQTGSTTLVSRNKFGNAAGVSSFTSPVVSADGNFVVFSTTATDMTTTPDPTARSDVFLWDRTAGTITMISRNAAGTAAGNGNSGDTALPYDVSADGRFVVYLSGATDLTSAADTNGATDVFVWARTTGINTLVSKNAAGTAAGNDRSLAPTISADGRFVAYLSRASNLTTTPDTNAQSDSFLWDRATGENTLVSKNTAGTATGNGSSAAAVVSADGNYVVFESSAPDLTTLPDGNSLHDIFLWDRAAGATTLVSRDSSGTKAGNSSFDGNFGTPAISADGRYVAYDSNATNLIAGDNNSARDVFLWDRVAGTNTLVSRNAAGTGPANNVSDRPSVSADGGAVAYMSYATDLTGTADGNGADDVFVWDRATGANTLISKNAAGKASGNGESNFPSIAIDGGFVAYYSFASNLGPIDFNARFEVYGWDRATGTNTLITRRHPVLPPATANRTSYIDLPHSYGSAVSADGRLTVFSSIANDLAGAGNPDNRNLYLYDRVAGTIAMVSRNAAGTDGGNSDSHHPVISADGRYVAYYSFATDLLGLPTKSGSVYLWDRVTGLTTLVSKNVEGTDGGNGLSDAPRISADGSFVAFSSRATDLTTTADTNGEVDAFVWNRATGTTTLISRNTAGTAAGNGASVASAISADGRYVSFATAATDLTATADANGVADIFVWDRVTGTSTLVSRNAVGAATGNGPSTRSGISAEGRYVAFASRASDLTTTPDANGEFDVFLWDRVTGVTTLISHNAAGTGAANKGVTSPDPTVNAAVVISADGTVVTYTSRSTDLTATTDTNDESDVFLWDRATGANTLVSKNMAGTAAGNSYSKESVPSADGRYVAFVSRATDLTATTDTNGNQDVFLWDRLTGLTTLVSRNTSGTAAGNKLSAGGLEPHAPVLTPDGSFVAFNSDASDLLPRDYNGVTDVFLVNLSAPAAAVGPVAPTPRVAPVGTVVITFTTRVTGLDLADLSLTRDGGTNLLTGAQILTPNEDGTVWTLGNLAGLTGADGSYTLTLTAAGSGIANPYSGRGLAGGNAAASFVVDTTPPDTAITGKPAAITKTTAAAFTFTGADGAGSGVGGFEYQLDGGAWTPTGAGVANFAGLADGSHTFRVRSLDAAGNPDGTPAMFTWTVDTTAPDTTLTGTPPAASPSAAATFAFTGADGAGTGVAKFEYQLDGGVWTTAASPVMLTGLADGPHTFRVKATDVAGNPDGSPAMFAWTVDTAAPDTTLTGTPPAASNSPSATFTFAGTDPGGTGVTGFLASLDGGAFASATSPLTYSGLADGSHTVQLKAVDAAGNADGSPATFAWTIDTVAPDTTLTGKPAVASPTAAATFTFAGSDPGGTGVAKFEYQLDGGAWTVAVSPRTLPGLADGAHTFQVKATDAAGNADATPATFTWTIDTAAPDTTFTGTPSALTASAAATFAFAGSDVGGTGVVGFESQFDNGAWTTAASPLTLSGLPDGSHTFRVRAIDLAGNPDGTPATFTWTVDTVAPDTTITGKPAANSNSPSAAFTLAGADGTGSGVVGHEASLDGGPFVPVPGGGQTYSGLADGPHTLRVRAVDAAGNADATPAVYTWTVDTVAPTASFTSTPPALTKSAAATFAFAGPDAGLTFDVSLDGGPFAPAAGPVSLTKLADGRHTLAVRATDPSGNTGPAAAYEWVVDTTPPAVTGFTAAGPTTGVVTYTLTFSEPVTGLTPAAFALTANGLTGTAVLDVTPTGVTAVVRVSTGTGTGTVGLSLTGGAADPTGNPAVGLPASGPMVAVDTVGPGVVVAAAPGQANPAADGPVAFAVTFSEPVTGFDAADVVLGGTAGPTAATVSGSGANYTVRVTGMVRPGTVTVAVGPGAAVDAAGNPSAAAGPVGVEFRPPTANAPPTVSDIADQGLTAGTVGGPIRFTIGDARTPASGLTVTVAASTPIMGVVLGGSGADRTVTLTPAAGQTGTATVTITVADPEGLTATETFNVAVVSGAVPELVGYPRFAAGADAGGGQATLFNPDRSVGLSATPFGGFTGGVRTAAADFNADGVADLLVGTGPGGPTRVRVLDGKDGRELFAVDPFEPAFVGGVYLAAGDVTGDGAADLIITPDEGGGPRCRVFAGRTGGLVADFFGIDDPNFRGGARAAVGDVNGDRVGDLIVAAGFGGGPRVAGFDGKSLATGPRRVFADFFMFEQTLRNGVFIASGDLNGDGFAEVIAGGGPGGGPRVFALSGKGLTSGNQEIQLANFFGGNPDSRGGIRVAVKDLDGDTKADVVVGAGAGAGSRVTAYLGKDIPAAGPPPAAADFDAFGGFPGGVFVG